MYHRARVSSLFLCPILFLPFIVVNPKSTFYISRRVYSKRIFFGQIDALKKRANIRAVSAVRDSPAYCETSRLVWHAARVRRVRAREDNGIGIITTTGGIRGFCSSSLSLCCFLQ